MKVIVAGGRDFADNFSNASFMADTLAHLEHIGVIGDNPELVCGMAKGADLMAKAIFDNRGLTVHKRPADWQDMSEPCIVGHNYYGTYNKLAGMKRNHAMGDEADILIAFWNKKSKGTKDMIDYMTSLTKPVHIFNY
jgi:hypothetical protein